MSALFPTDDPEFQQMVIEETAALAVEEARYDKKRRIRHCGAWQEHQSHIWWRQWVFWETPYWCSGNVAYGVVRAGRPGTPEGDDQ